MNGKRTLDGPKPLQFAPPDPRQPLDGGACAPLTDREIAVYAFALAASAADCEQWWRLLSSDERERAARLMRDADRDRYIVAHGALRRLLSAHCGIEPAALRFTASAAGKPALDGEARASGLRFNLAHSADRAIVAIARGVEVGVDVEHARGDVDAIGLAERYFSRAERDALEATPPNRRRESFFRLWVAKEAVLKAHGSGLATPLDAFSIRFASECDAGIDAADGDVVPGEWRVRMLPTPDRWYAALCSPPKCRLRLSIAG